MISLRDLLLFHGIAGFRSASQADPAASAAAAVKPASAKPASATSTIRVNQPTLAGPSHTTIHAAQADSRIVANADPSDPNLIAHISRRISSLSSKDRDSTSPASTIVAARVASQGYQQNSIPSGTDRGLGVSPLPSPPMTHAPNIHVHGFSVLYCHLSSC